MTVSAVNRPGATSPSGIATVMSGGRSGRRLRRALASTRFWRFAVLILVLVGWQTVSGTLIDSLFISSPLEIAGRIAELFVTGAIWPHLAATYSEVAAGYLLAAAVGIATGVLLGRVRFLAEVAEPFILALYSIPKIALAPIFILWLGIGAGSKIGVAFLSAVFLIFTGTFTGVRSIDEELVTLARLMGSSRWDVLKRVAIPAAAPFIFSGLITGLPFALIGAVVGEFMSSNVGLGFYILRAGSTLDAAGTFAGIILLVVAAMAAAGALRYVESRIVRWQVNPSEAGEPSL